MSNEQYAAVCKDRFDAIEEGIKESNNQVLERLETIDHRLFYDNGNECLQSRINRHEQMLGWIKWLAMGIGAILLQLAGSGIYRLIEHFSK